MERGGGIVTRSDWMSALAEHVGAARASYPDDDLVVAFDIDGTILDTRHLVVNVLLSYDRWHETQHFIGLTADDVVHHETRIDDILAAFGLADRDRAAIRAWYCGTHGTPSRSAQRIGRTKAC
jgi:phosphoglycolate phosphatase-like HAD superfamily hydrolase